MASLKKEVAALLSRFDAAQEAFTSNTVDMKKARKAHKKELKKANKSVSKLEEQVADLQKELMETKQKLTLAEAKASSAGAAKTTGKKRPGRKPGPKPGGKRGPGRPRKTAADTVTPATQVASSAQSADHDEASTASVTPKRRGRPAGSKNKSTGADKSSDGPKRGPGRPRKNAAAPESPLQVIKGFGPAMARKFEEAGVTTPAQVSRLSNAKMTEILDSVGPRYRNASDEKIQSYREAASAAK